MKLIGMLLLALVLCSTACAYSVSDLPPGWGFDPNRIQGELLPPVSGGPASDPNTWLLPIGGFSRIGATNQYVREIVVVATSASVGVFLRMDPDKHTSISWEVQAWSIPGPWYIVLDAVSPAGRRGAVKTKRYTIVGAGYVPDSAEPILD